MNYQKLILILGIISVGACSSAPPASLGDERIKLEKDVVLGTLNDQKKPEWAVKGESEPFRIENGKVLSVGVAELKGDERPTAGLRVAYNNALVNISKSIENNIQGLFQNAEEGASYDSGSIHYIGSELSSLTSNGIKNQGQYWERVAQSQEDGSKKIVYRLYSLAVMSESDLKAKIREATAKGRQEKKLSQKFQEQVDKHMDSLVKAAVDNQDSSSK